MCLLCSFADSCDVGGATDEAAPTMFLEAETLRLLSALISWQEDTGRSMRIKVHAVCLHT